MGTQLVPRLADAGHEVFAMSRRESKARASKLGAVPVIADALDRTEVDAAVREVAPDVVVHQLTAIRHVDTRHFERSFAATDRLRVEGTDNLLAAARAAGARRFLAQSFAGWPFAREGGPVKTEEDRLDPNPPGDLAPLLAAIRHLEDAVTGAEGIEGLVLRYGPFYGPGTAVAPDGGIVEEVRKRRFPLVGDAGASPTAEARLKEAEAHLRAARYARASMSPRTIPVCRAMVSSSFVGITHAETRLPGLEIRGPLRPFASSSISMPSHADASQIRRRISGEFSPMPAVNTRPSSPPRAAVSAPISFAARYTK